MIIFGRKVKNIMKKGSIILILVTISGMLLNQSCSSASYSTKDIKMEKIEKSKQYKDGKFVNYKPAPDLGFVKMLPIMWDFIFTGNDRKPDVELPTQLVDFDKVINSKNDEL